nr:hypothetical protein BDOA9_0110180 [Bradyrhizobium sp. DOA9]
MVGGIVAADIIAPVEVAIAVMRAMMAPVPVIAAISAVAKAAMVIAADMTVNGGRGTEATAVKSAAAETADMATAKAAAMEAATAETAAMKVATMPVPAMPAAYLRDEAVGRRLGRGRRRRIDQGECFSAARGAGRQHQCRGGCDPEQAHRACSESQYSQHGILPRSGQRKLPRDICAAAIAIQVQSLPRSN